MKVEFKGMEITCTTDEFQRLMQQGIFDTQSAGTSTYPGQVYPGNIQKLPDSFGKLPDDFAPLPETPPIKWKQDGGTGSKPNDDYEWRASTKCVPLYGCQVDMRLIDHAPKYDPNKDITGAGLSPDQMDALNSAFGASKSNYEPETCTPGVSTCGVCYHSGVCTKEKNAKKATYKSKLDIDEQ